MKKRIVFLIALTGILITAFAAVAAAGEVIYVSEPSVFDTPKMFPRADASLWNMDYRCNPALLKLDCPYGLIFDTYYEGSFYKMDNKDYGNSLLLPGSFVRGSLTSEYVTDVVGGDAGFAVKLNDRSNLAFIFNYRYGNLLGDGDFTNAFDDGTGLAGRIDGSFVQRLDSHTFSPSVLFDFKVNDALTLGAALKYAYISERFQDDITGAGSWTALPEHLLIDKDLWLKYHYLSPEVGVSFVPSDRFTLNASLAAGFYFGRVDKDASMHDDALIGADNTYTEDLDSSGVSGWDIAAKVRPQFKVNDKVSIPLVLDFWYKDFKWAVDGPSSGYFAAMSYGGPFQGPGTIDYHNDATTWDITAGAGVKYDAGWATLSGLASYTHWSFDNNYDQENMISSPVVFTGFNGLTSFSQDDKETRDFVSLGLTIEKEFSPTFSADFGMRYDFGWGHRQYDLAYTSRWETNPLAPLTISTDGRDTYQDLTLSNHFTITPIEHLSVVFGGFVKIPVDSIDYDLNGTAAGLTTANAVVRQWGFEGGVLRAASDDNENTGWEYGGLLSISYEFGCPKPVPPVVPAPPAPAPQLTPMSQK